MPRGRWRFGADRGEDFAGYVVGDVGWDGAAGWFGVAGGSHELLDVILPYDEHNQPGQHAVGFGHPNLAVTYGLGVVGCHRRGRPAHAGHVPLVRGEGHRLEFGDVLGHRRRSLTTGSE
jgi:hypothetical protein